MSGLGTPALGARTSAAGGSARAPARPWRAVPGPRGRRLVGSLAEVRSDRLAFVDRAFAEFGDVVAFRMPGRRLLLLRDPEHLRRVLGEEPGRYEKGLGLAEARPFLGRGPLTSSAARAAGQRRRLRPAFGPDRLGDYVPEMAALAEAMLGRWSGPAREGQTVAVGDDLDRLTLEILGRTLLGVDLAADAPELARELSRLGDWAMDRMAAPLRIPLAVPTPANRAARRALCRVRVVARGLLSRTEAGGAVAGGQLLRSIRAADGEDGDAELPVEELLTFLLAGHDTTAAWLSWVCWLLASHAEAQDRVAGELAAAFGSAPVPPDALQRLPYLKAVLHEALRLFPPIWMITRRAIRSDRIGGYRIPAGTDVLLGIWSLHRHPRFWDRPEEFAPERFLGSGQDAATRGCFLPFGAGERACLGGRFALLEATVVVAAIVRLFRLRPAGPAPAAKASLTLRPDPALELRLDARAPAELRHPTPRRSTDAAV